MKKNLLIAMLFLMSLGLSAQTYQLDTSKSNIEWTGKKVAGKHHGHINFESGKLTKKGASFNSGKFVVDMKSLTNEDLTDAETNAQLVGHLKSDDFFGVEKFPTAQLIITKGTVIDGDKYEFIGNLTIKDKTEPVKFNATVSSSKKQHIFTGKITVDRSKFDVRYGSGSFFENLGDNMIYDKFDLDFIAVFKE